MRTALACAVLLLATPAAWADDDLDRIPPAAEAPASELPQGAAAPASASAGLLGGSGRIYLEDDISATGLRRAGAVPSAAPASWEERGFADLRQDWQVDPQLHLILGDRFNLRNTSQIPVPSRENIENDLREAYASYAPVQRLYIDVGRINLKSGVAIGYNPTDFFRSRAVVDPVSLDPTALREDRLGTAMATAQGLWDGGALTLAAAPKLTREKPLYTQTTLPSADPMFDRTNAQNRFLAKLGITLAEDVSPEFLLYHDDRRTLAGGNLAVAIGNDVVAYAEYAGGVRGNLIAEAWDFAHHTDMVPAALPPVIPAGARRWRNEAVLGFSYATTNQLTINLEYQASEVGLSPRDWKRWFAANSPQAPGYVANALWLLRGYAAEQQELTSQQAIFLRADRPDLIWRGLEVSGFISVNPADGSLTTQASAQYALSNAWTLGTLASFWAGPGHSEYGSLRQVSGVLLRISRDL